MRSETTIRVLFWCSRFWPQIGGIQVLSAGLLPALRARGYDLVVVTEHEESDQPAQVAFQGIPIYRLPFWQALEQRDEHRIQAVYRQVLALKRDFRPQLTHLFHIGPEAFFDLHTRGAAPGPVACSLHSVYPAELLGPEAIVGRTLCAVNWVAASSAAVMARLHQALPEVAPRSSVIYNGIDAPVVPPAPLPFSPSRLLCLGRLIADKGYDLALSAFVAVRARHPTVHLVIAGDGPARGALEQQARLLGLADAVTFTGWVEPRATARLINTATVVVIPSRTEGLSQVALQAGQLARPVVAARVGGLPEVVLDGETGLIVERDDSAALARAILALLNEPRRAVRLGQAASRRIAANFTWERYVGAYDDLFTRLIAGAVGSSARLL